MRSFPNSLYLGAGIQLLTADASEKGHAEHKRKTVSRRAAKCCAGQCLLKRDQVGNFNRVRLCQYGSEENDKREKGKRKKSEN